MPSIASSNRTTYLLKSISDLAERYVGSTGNLRQLIAERAAALCAPQNKNPDSIGDKVTRLILQDFFDFSAPRISNTTGNSKSTQTSADSSEG